MDVRADREVERGPLWLALDAVVAWASAGIAVGASEYTASVFHGAIISRAAVVVWFLAISLRRIIPVAALWAGAAATVAVFLIGDPVTNVSLASALPLTMIAQGRSPKIAALVAGVPVVAVLAA